jgi:hypothetical protein
MARQLNSEEQRMFAEVIAADNSAAVEVSMERLRDNLLQRLETSLELSPDLGLWFTKDTTSLPS